MPAVAPSDNPIRKAAVLFRTLDPESAAALLAQLSDAEAKAVRTAVRELEEITEDDRLSVATELRARTRVVPFAGETEGVELELSTPPSGDVDAEPPHAVEPRIDQAGEREETALPPASGIGGADPATLAQFLRRENSAVVAVVLSHLPAERAAALLDELPFDQRAEALNRLADLGEGDEESLQVVTADLAAWVARQQQESRRRADRLSTIKSILSSARPDARAELLSRLKNRGCGWVSELHPASQGPEAPEPAEAVPEPPRAIAAEPPADEPTAGAEPEAPPRPPAVPFALVTRLDAARLAAVMRRMHPRALLLALAGADEALQKRIESLIPSRHARQLRLRLESLGPTSLREVEAAQQAMAQFAAESLQLKNL